MRPAAPSTPPPRTSEPPGNAGRQQRAGPAAAPWSAAARTPPPAFRILRCFRRTALQDAAAQHAGWHGQGPGGGHAAAGLEPAPGERQGRPALSLPALSPPACPPAASLRTPLPPSLSLQAPPSKPLVPSPAEPGNLCEHADGARSRGADAQGVCTKRGGRLEGSLQARRRRPAAGRPSAERRCRSAAAIPAPPAAQTMAYNMADSVQYPSALEMEKRCGRRAGCGASAGVPARLLPAT